MDQVEKITTKVMLLQDKTEAGVTFWFAQGLDVDLFASGHTQQEAQRNFERAFAATVAIHVAKYGSLAKMRIPAPGHVWKQFVDFQAKQQIKKTGSERIIRDDKEKRTAHKAQYYQQAAA